jgi:hypothetical protein
MQQGLAILNYINKKPNLKKYNLKNKSLIGKEMIKQGDSC